MEMKDVEEMEKDSPKRDTPKINCRKLNESYDVPCGQEKETGSP